MAITVVLYHHGREVPRDVSKVYQPRHTQDDVDGVANVEKEGVDLERLRINALRDVEACPPGM